VHKETNGRGGLKKRGGGSQLENVIFYARIRLTKLDVTGKAAPAKKGGEGPLKVKEGLGKPQA